jgi:ubiquinone/menaquinone biosynthesis C-methylase UbiE
VVIPLPYPSGSHLQGAILEHSERGLSFRTELTSVYLLPGTPIRDLQICNASGEILSHKKAQVMHVAPVYDWRGEARYLSISVTYGIEKSFERGRLPDQTARKPRRSSFLKRVSGFLGHWLMNTSSRLLPKPKTLQQENDVEIVRYPNKRGEEIVGILNTTPRQEGTRLRAPVIIIPPAYSKRKESTSGLAITLVENFKQHNRDVVVLRFDDIHSLGESYKHPENRYAGKENLNHTMSQCVEDIETTLDFVYNNELFAPTRVLLLSFSLQGIMSRRVVYKDKGERIDYWMGIMGAPCGQEVMRNAAGGVDYIAQCAEGVKNKYANILGVTVDIDLFCRDAINEGLAFMSNAKQEIAEVPIPVTWITGLYDAWIDPANLKEFMEVPARGERTYLEIAAGHTPLNSKEALELFLLISQQIWRFLYDEELEPVLPANKDFFLTRQREWARTPKFPLSNKQEYWQKYLLGESEQAVGYDVISVSDEYQDFMDLQIKLLDIKKGHSIVDMGCGTGNFAERFLSLHGGNARRLPDKLTLLDFVPDAVETAAGKVRSLQQQGLGSGVELEVQTHTLELSPLRTLRRFLRNEFYSYDRLKGLLPALTEYSVEAWKSVASRDWMFHEILAGAQMTREHQAYLKQALPSEERQLVVEMNRLIRFLKNEVEDQDLTSAGRLRFRNGEQLALSDLSLSLLNIETGNSAERLPFNDESVDRILCSLVLSYLNNPLETLAEFYRILKPGSVLVISSMQPDTDISRIYMNLIRKMETSPDLEIPPGMTREEFIESAREYVSSAAFLVRLVEEGHFSFFTEGEMIQMLQRSGFKKVKSHKSFGNPPQAFVLTALR